MAKMPPLPPLPESGMQLDLRLATDVTCDNCGSYTFEECVLMKHLSELVSPTKKAGFIPIPVFQCASCGHVNDAFLPRSMQSKAPEEAPRTEVASKIEIVK